MTEVAQETPVEIAASADRKEDDDVFGPDVSEGLVVTRKSPSRRILQHDEVGIDKKERNEQKG